MNNKKIYIVIASAITMATCGILCLAFIIMHDGDMHSKLNKNAGIIDSLNREIKLRDSEIMLYRNLIKQH